MKQLSKIFLFKKCSDWSNQLTCLGSLYLMSSSNHYTYSKFEAAQRATPNYWDLAALIFVSALLVLCAIGARPMVGHFELGQAIPIDLSPKMLPYYALRTVLRMFIALFFSLVFTFIFGTWAAKSRQAERLIVPAVDVLQSVPVLGLLSITVSGFIVLFKGSMLGPECAAIFAIFIAQVWNMTLSLYQSILTVPKELKEASRMFRLNPWQCFWKIEVPFAMPGLLWNTMMSMSGSWVFLVASEAITVNHQNITLPGIGSYIALAIDRSDAKAVVWVIVAMLLVIFLYDQLIFRPLVAWSEKFKITYVEGEDGAESWVLNIFQKARFFRQVTSFLQLFAEFFVNFSLFPRVKSAKPSKDKKQHSRVLYGIWWMIVVVAILLSTAFIAHYIISHIEWIEIKHVAFLGAVTALRVMILIILSAIVWVPIGVRIGLNPKAAAWIQPIVQFLAAFPAILLFPVVVVAILRFHLNPNIWTSPLMVLGTQWYILFNVIAATMALPENMRYAVATLNVKGWLWWRRLILPAIFPYLITGAITAAGGAWNMSIIAEAVHWGSTQIYAVGLGAYIDKVSINGDFPRVILGMVMMSLYVLVINRLLWRPLYQLAENKYKLS